MRRGIMILVGLLALSPFPLSGFVLENQGRSREPAAYLNMGLGARAAGLGKAFAGACDDVTSVYWNPSGLARLDQAEVQATSSSMDLDRSFHFFGLGIPIRIHWNQTHLDDLEFSEDAAGWKGWLAPPARWNFVFAVGSALYQVRNIERRDSFGTRQGEFSDNEYTYFFSVGHDVLRDLSFGYTYRYHVQRIEQASAKGGGFDFGAQLHPRALSGLNLGVSVINVGGGEIRWKAVDELGSTDEYEEQLPRKVRTGASYRLRKPDFLISLDADFVNQQNPMYYAGLEVKPVRFLALRAGADNRTPTAGLGFEQKIGGRRKVLLDYAFTFAENALSETHRFSLALRF